MNKRFVQEKIVNIVITVLALSASGYLKKKEVNHIYECYCFQTSGRYSYLVNKENKVLKYLKKLKRQKKGPNSKKL